MTFANEPIQHFASALDSDFYALNAEQEGWVENAVLAGQFG